MQKFPFLFIFIIPCCYQGIIHATETKTFAKEPKYAKLLRELKRTPVRHYKQSLLVFLVCLFKLFCCRITCKWVFFPSCVVIYIIDLFTVKTFDWIFMSMLHFGKRRHYCLWFSLFLIISFATDRSTQRVERLA